MEDKCPFCGAGHEYAAPKQFDCGTPLLIEGMGRSFTCYERELTALRTRLEAKEARLKEAEGLIKNSSVAIEALLRMEDKLKPRKLDDALTWRQNDELAHYWATEAVANIQAFLTPPEAEAPEPERP